MANLSARWACVPTVAVRTRTVRSLALLIALSGAIPVNALPPVEANTPSKEIEIQTSYRRHYKATAYITLLSLTIFSRAGVGFGFAGTDERTRGIDQSISLRFLSGSTPDHAHGLNRFGFIHENIEQKNRTTIAADYFGLMTANGEESLSDAKAALNAAGGEQVAFVAARAIVNRQKTSYSVRHLLLPASYRAANADQLLARVQGEFAVPLPGEAEKTETLSGDAGTFLSSLRQAILTPAGVYQSRIVFNGKTFQFHASKRADAKTGGELRRAGLTASPNAIMQLSGVLHNEKTKEISTFRLWFEQGSANFLPLRFEFKPKSYLRLVFDEELAPQ